MSRGGLLFCLALYGTVPCAAYSARQKSRPPRLPTYDTPRPALRLRHRFQGEAQIRALIGTPTPDPPDEPGRPTLLSSTVYGVGGRRSQVDSLDLLMQAFVLTVREHLQADGTLRLEVKEHSNEHKANINN